MPYYNRDLKRDQNFDNHHVSLALVGVRGFGRGICKGSVQLRVRSAQTYGAGPMRLKDVQRYLIW